MKGGLERAAIREAEQQRESARVARAAAMVARSLERRDVHCGYHDTEFLGGLLGAIADSWD